MCVYIMYCLIKCAHMYNIRVYTYVYECMSAFYVQHIMVSTRVSACVLCILVCECTYRAMSTSLHTHTAICLRHVMLSHVYNIIYRIHTCMCT